MARMIPPDGAVQNGSARAEPAIYKALSLLDDSFIVIHSLPWICAAVKSINPSYAPTGEVDFIVLHPDYGILAIEVKGGQFTYDQYQFVYLHNKQVFRPIDQLIRGTFALRDLLLNRGVRITIGYAWVFPDVDMHGKAVPSGLVDTAQRPLFLDHRDIPNIKENILRLMRYWQKTQHSRPPGQELVDKALEILAPKETYILGWDARIDNDNRTWLVLTDQQRRLLRSLNNNDRTIVTGGAGTGKTVLAIALARLIAGENKRILFLTFNNPLFQKIQKQLADEKGVEVFTFHQLCGRAERALGVFSEPQSKTQEWFDIFALQALAEAIRLRKFQKYDALIIDEGQIFHQEWYEILLRAIGRVHVFADQTQAFSYEKGLTNKEIERIIDAEHVGMLTENMRSPRQVFERLDVALENDYDQISRRPEEADALQEIASFDVLGDLLVMLRCLAEENIQRDSIAVLTSHAGIQSLQRTSLLEQVQALAGAVETSSKVRGLEFPVVVTFDLPLNDAMQLVNAYARATTRVIALYDIWHLQSSDGESAKSNRLIVELLKNPQFAEALKNPLGYVLAALGWAVEEANDQDPKILWNNTLGAWVVVTEQRLPFPDKMWVPHLITRGKAPVISMETGFGWLLIDRYEHNNYSLDANPDGEGYTTVVCPNCNKLALRSRFGTEVICAHCGFTQHHPLPTIVPPIRKQVDILRNPEAYTHDQKRGLGLHMLAMIAFRKQSPENQALLASHVASRERRLAYQPLLLFIGIDILNTAYKGALTNDALTHRYSAWVLPQERQAIMKTLPRSTAYWLQKNWLVKISPGIYQRSGVYLPDREISEEQSEGESESGEVF